MLAASKDDFHLVDEILAMITEKNVNATDYVGWLRSKVIDLVNVLF